MNLLGGTPFEFRKDFGTRKVPGLLRGVICVIPHLAVLVELRLVTDRHTDKRP